MLQSLTISAVSLLKLFIGSRDSDMDILGTVIILPSIDTCFFFLFEGREKEAF